jgi:hypothetical protein
MAIGDGEAYSTGVIPKKLWIEMVGAFVGDWMVAIVPCATSATLTWALPRPPWLIPEMLVVLTKTLTPAAKAGVPNALQTHAKRRSFFILVLAFLQKWKALAELKALVVRQHVGAHNSIDKARLYKRQ